MIPRCPRVYAALAGGLVAAVLAGCSSSGSSSTATSGGTAGSATAGSATGSAGLAAAKANVDARLHDPATIGPATAIGKPIPKNKTIVYIDCGAIVCTNIGSSLQAASTELGWTFKSIQAQPTSQSIQAAFDAAIRLHPSGVASVGFTTATYRRELATLKADGIPVLSASGTDPVGNGLDLQLQSAQSPTAMALLADKAIVDNGGKGDIGMILLTGYPIIVDYGNDFSAEIAKNCPACKVTTLQIQPTAIGTTAAASIANFLRANPGIKQIYLGYDDLAQGLASAVKNVGASMPEVYGWAPTPADMSLVQTGGQTVVVPQDTDTMGWQLADAFARYFTNESLTPDESWEPWVLWGKEYNNVPGSDTPTVVASYQAQFEKLWGK
jgi:ABC-type sugar transport system substrate-binding protein